MGTEKVVVGDNGVEQEAQKRYRVFCRYIAECMGAFKRSQLDFLDVYLERSTSQKEKDAIGKIQKRVHNDIGITAEMLKGVYFLFDPNYVLTDDIPHFGDKRNGKNQSKG